MVDFGLQCSAFMHSSSRVVIIVMEASRKLTQITYRKEVFQATNVKTR